MQKIVSQIRNMEVIEKELQNAAAGVLAVLFEEDKIRQIPSTFIYLDKNIYAFLDEDDDFYEDLHMNTVVSFNVLKNEKPKKSVKDGFLPAYNLISINISGIIKKVEEPKVVEELRLSYLKKYTKNTSAAVKDTSAIERILLIDTEEIQAVEIMGG